MGRAVLMGDPTYFSIRAGANPHTRTRLGLRKRVDRERAIAQWHGLAQLLVDLGVRVFVIPPRREHPGLVYPANAGFLYPLEEPLPPAAKCFYLSNLIPARSGERPIYQAVIERLGFPTGSIGPRFEGEAEFFPLGDRYVFTFGRIERQRFALRLGWPPYRRIYGLRSDVAALPELQAIAADREVVPLELVDEAYYHGDTVLCSFGPGRRYALAYLEGFDPASRSRLEEMLGGDLILLSRGDAALYAANAFPLALGDRHVLVLPAGVSGELLEAVRERGVEPLTVDVSEFMAKGGGSVKCMICDLGPLVEEGLSEDVRRFRAERAYRAALDMAG